MNDTAQALEAALGAHRQGDLARAKALYQGILEVEPEFFDALHLLGVLYHQAGDNEHARELISRALCVQPENADAHCNLASVSKALGDTETARRELEKAIELAPSLPQAHNNLGGLLQEQGELTAAVAAYERAIRIEPGYADAHHNLASALLLLGHREQARRACANALAQDPSHIGALATLGKLLEAEEQFAEAEQVLRKAVGHEPGNSDIHHNLGTLLDKLRRWEEALQSYAQALALNPQNGAALSSYLHLKRSLLDWDGTDSLFQRFLELLKAGAAGLTPFSFLAENSTPAQQLACARLWAAQKGQHMAAGSHGEGILARGRREKIRVGYVSADFHRHPTAYLTAGMFEAHDRARFSTHGYSSGPDDGSAVRKRLTRAFDHFVDVRGLSQREIVRRIEADEIDILVDLKGYTLDASTGVFAARPAPIQVNFLGYPGTMGAEFIDYIIADVFVIPEEQGSLYAENIVYLPHCYQPNDSLRQIAQATPTRQDCGLPEEGFVFCCFNASWKFSPETFDVWARILVQVPESVMWLLDSLPGSRFQQNTKAQLARRGVDPDRIVFNPRLPLPEYLARYRHAGLFLDTWPYNAHTTASDALWAGCPLVTVPGGTFASRVAGSLLRAAGLPGLIAASVDEYQRLAVHLATHPDELKSLRGRLAENRRQCPLFDTQDFTRDLERAYELMFEAALTGKRPRVIHV